MAPPGKDSRDIPLRVTIEGDEAIVAEAERRQIDKNEVIRIALSEYFQRQGRTIEFRPHRGGKRTRMTEQQTFNRVVGRVLALGLPQPVAEYSLKHKTYDLAWPEQRAAVEISRQKKPADSNDWTVGLVRPTMKDDEIDQVLKGLPL